MKTAPQKEEKIKLKLPAVTVQAGQEAFLYLRFYAAAATTWCKSGHGVVLFLKPGFEKLRWFGRNPFENYSDRKRAALVDLYESTVTDQYVPYIMPQEHGNHTDVRWLSLGRESARLLVVAAGPMEFSASHYTAQDIDSACHTHDLHPRAEVILNLDYRQRGLGTESCGPGPLEQYKIKPGRYAWSYTLQPLESLKSKSVCK